MSTSIHLHCNQQWSEGGCATFLVTDAHTVEEAEAAGRRLGWRTHTDGKAYCPGHSGNRRPVPDQTVVQLRPSTPSRPAPVKDAAEAPAPVELVLDAAQHLRTLAAATDTEMATNTYWRSELADQEHLFAHGIHNAVGGPPGLLAGLFGPGNARLLAQILERHTRPQTPIPAEIFLLARNIHRSRNR
ncbi:hypothetical protein [Streptomyces cylindrosporus]|uniref:Uncharacterized protein n=1 Tax=Streptomyces cylindrosporus TaxID=2927583 RepID=A0ABS9YK76_9ACTN|nr:hypothetical protein [Streptomyces cylindrosporus]MCI3277584.1 hypothetical protein [Streptomyces cylindrosporus]